MTTIADMQLRPFQLEGAGWLARRKRALLADEMRLGKTRQAIAAMRMRRAKHVCIVCPAIARTHWRTELSMFYPTIHPTVVSYDEARLRKVPHPVPYVKWDLIVLDESHFLKNPEAARTLAVYGKKGLIRFVSNGVWCLTGTPAPNGIHELWTMLKVFGVIKYTYYDFIKTFCIVDPVSEKIRGTKPAKRAEIKQLLRPVMLRRLKKEVAPELPKCTVQPFYIDADYSNLDLCRPVNTHLHKENLESLEAKYKAQMQGMTSIEILEFLDRQVEELATLRKLHAVLKTPALIETLKYELDSGMIDKIVVFGYHRDALHIPYHLMKNDYRCDLLYGGTSSIKRDRILKRFARPVTRPEMGTQILFASITAAGTSIDLSAACDGIMLERDWVPANNAQALERMGGFKQTRPISIRDFIIPGSVDEIIGKTIARKMRDLTSLFD